MDGVFAINKPSGVTSANFLTRVNKIFNESENFKPALDEIRNDLERNKPKGYKRRLRQLKVKMGHGGTLDPLAQGVLIVGVGAGTKKLGDYLNGSVKVYEAEALFGGSTTTGDSEGQLLSISGTDHITKELLAQTAQRFVGHLQQTPPIFSALKMEGMPLYEYARRGLPLPRKIEPREVQVYELQVADDSLSTDHGYEFLKSEIDEDGTALVDKLSGNPTLNDHHVTFSNEYMEKCKADSSLSSEPEPVHEIKEVPENFKAPLLHFTSKVSSGTYIRSLISDIGRAVGSSSYMVKLVRHKQAEWDLKKNVFEIEDFENNDAKVWGTVLMKVFEKGGSVNVREEFDALTKSSEQVPDTKRAKLEN
ncbi:hypothetical protein OGAPHI_000280 [Ogataea philodendri]|uniref:tRNA pseudouridine(55) synthase n=1 Tax=Ogataea philodendri TaxID=1378263 RepID=A0A9P8PHW8_9ASCO|nr:uncharacterized protein OGAPHI_000280 [Ogataea philodendri]KAH3671577.1 hypothetical protein OGAPHI_000280 [Ogataea philodendri]